MQQFHGNNCTATEKQCFQHGPCQDVKSGECPPLEAATKQWLVKNVTDWEDLVCPVVICEVCRRVAAYSLLIVTNCKSAINPITNPNPIYSHSIIWQYQGPMGQVSQRLELTVSCKQSQLVVGLDNGIRKISVVRSHYQETTNEDMTNEKT
jgi:hypothetical protein